MLIKRPKVNMASLTEGPDSSCESPVAISATHVKQINIPIISTMYIFSLWTKKPRIEIQKHDDWKMMVAIKTGIYCKLVLNIKKHACPVKHLQNKVCLWLQGNSLNGLRYK